MNTVVPILNLIDSIINTYVFGVYNNINGTVISLWTAGFTLFVAIYGFRIVVSGSMSAEETFNNAVKMMFVFVIATQADNFTFFVFNFFTEFPNELSAVILDSSQATVNGTATEGTASGTNAALGRFFDDGFAAAGAIALQGGTFNPLPYLYSFLVIIGTLALTGISLILLIVAKVFVAVLLAVGPLFVLALMFPTTRGFFEGWFRALMNYAFIPLFAYAVLALILRILTGTTVDLLANSGPGQNNVLPFMASFLLMTFIGVVVMSQVPNMTASVTGGFAVQTQNIARRAANRGSRSIRQAGQGFADRFRGGPGPTGGARPNTRPQPRRNDLPRSEAPRQRADTPSGAASTPGS